MDDIITLDKINKVLSYLGIPRNISGFYQIREAILIANSDKQFRLSIVKDIYNSLADKFSKTPYQVERNIRYAIQASWDSYPEIINKIFSNSSYNQKPTNKNFIYTIAQNLDNIINDNNL